MEKANIAVVSGATNPHEIIQQFLAFAEEQGGSLWLSVRDADRRIVDFRDKLDEIIWQFKVHAPQGYTLNAATGSPIMSNYFWLPMIFDH